MINFLLYIFFFLFDVSKLKEEAEKGKSIGWFEVIISPSIRYTIIITFILGSVGITALFVKLSDIEATQTREQLIEIQSAIEIFKVNTGNYPTSIDELIGNRPLRSNWNIDKWGRPLRYSLKEEGFELTSMGEDGIMNSEDDLTIVVKKGA